MAQTGDRDTGDEDGDRIQPQDTIAASTADPANNPGGDGVVISENAVAQSNTGTHTFKVLMASLALVVVVLLGMYFLHLGPLSTNGGAGGQSGTRSHEDAEQFHAAPPSPKQAPPGMPESRGVANGAQ